MTFAIDKIDGRVHINTACHNPCQKKLGDAVLATEGLPGSTDKLEHFNYKGEWANA